MSKRLVVGMVVMLALVALLAGCASTSQNAPATVVATSAPVSAPQSTASVPPGLPAGTVKIDGMGLYYDTKDPSFVVDTTGPISGEKREWQVFVAKSDFDQLNKLVGVTTNLYIFTAETGLTTLYNDKGEAVWQAKQLCQWFDGTQAKVVSFSYCWKLGTSSPITVDVGQTIAIQVGAIDEIVNAAVDMDIVFKSSAPFTIEGKATNTLTFSEHVDKTGALSTFAVTKAIDLITLTVTARGNPVYVAVTIQ